MVKVRGSRTTLRRNTSLKPKVNVLIPCLLVLGVITTSLLLLTAYVSTNLQAQPTEDISHINKKPSSSMDVPRNSNNKVTVGYAVSITGCGTDPLSEGAAVLKHAIHQASANGNYGYKMYAIVHPKGEDCGSQLKDLGYTVLIRDTPVAVEDIKGDFLRNKIESNGCCGEKELIKLEAYTIVEHPIVVHLDLDVLILQPMDALFDYMLGKTSDLSTIPVMWQEKPPPKEVNAFFTRDYNMVHASTKYKPVQGGFLVLRPSLKTYKEFCDIIREGDFRDGKGWGGVVGPFYGSMTFQGIIPYYYDYLNPGTSLELNRCIYNQMCDNPRDQRTINDVVHGKCRTGEKNCEDCRSRPLEDVVTAHFTLCQKP
mmetsp:Transcript_17186/g.26046  ORF Transcript_17186/g.26046 Transcript_17186/m.26046 type:complete len:369 (+) Transcript_17186:118-1224(+)